MSQGPHFGVDGKEVPTEGSVVGTSPKVCPWQPLPQGRFCWPLPPTAYVTLGSRSSSPCPSFPIQNRVFEEVAPGRWHPKGSRVEAL